MRAVDTNVLVRLFIADDAAQAAAAHRATVSEPNFVPKTVLVEFEWVLRGVYKESRATIVAALEALLVTTNIEVEDSIAVGRAIEWFRRGMDFADAVHLASSAHADAFLTFDNSMRRRASMLEAKPKVVTP